MGLFPEDTRILALDASTRNIGWCVGDTRKVRASGVYRPSGRKFMTRFRKIVAWLNITINSHQPTVLAVEEPKGNHGNRLVDQMLGYVVGACMTVATLYQVQVILVNPQSIKATKACKDNLRYAETAGDLQYGALDRPGGGDQADAIGCYLVALQKIGGRGRSVG